MAGRYREIAVSRTKRHELQIHARWLSDNTVVEIRKINREHVIKRPCTRITAVVRALESRSFVSIEIRRRSDTQRVVINKSSAQSIITLFRAAHDNARRLLQERATDVVRLSKSSFRTRTANTSCSQDGDSVLFIDRTGRF